MNKGRVHDVTHFYNLGKKWVPAYVISAFQHTNDKTVLVQLQPRFWDSNGKINIDLWIDINCDTEKYPNIAYKVVTLLSDNYEGKFQIKQQETDNFSDSCELWFITTFLEERYLNREPTSHKGFSVGPSINLVSQTRKEEVENLLRALSICHN